MKIGKYHHGLENSFFVSYDKNGNITWDGEYVYGDPIGLFRSVTDLSLLSGKSMDGIIRMELTYELRNGSSLMVSKKIWKTIDGVETLVTDEILQ